MTGTKTKVRGLFLAALMITSVFAGVVAFSGSVAAANASDYDAEIDEGQGYWSGQTLGEVDDFAQGESVVLEQQQSNGNWQFETYVDVDSDDDIVIETSDYPTGDYRLRQESGDNTVVNFTLREQTVTASADPVEVENGGAANQSTFTITSNRPSWGLVIANDDLTPDEINATFPSVSGTAVDWDGDGSADADDEADAFEITSKTYDTSETLVGNFTGAATGSYDFTFAANDTGVSDSATVNVSEPATGTVGLGSNLYTDELGDVASITITLEDTSQGIVRFGSAADNYQANITVTDGNGDGEVVVNVNTFLMGTGNADTFTVANEDDSISNEQYGSLGGSLIATGGYNVEVATGTNYNVNSQNVGTFDIQPRSTNALNTWTAPDAASLSGATAEDVAALVEDGTITEDDTVAKGDYLIHELDATGLEGVIASDSNGFFGVLNDNGATYNVSLTVTEVEPERNQPRRTVDINSSNTAVVAGEDVYYLVTNTDDIPAMPAHGEYQAEFMIAEESPLASADEAVNATWELAEGAIEIDTNDEDMVTVEAADGQTISGTSTYAPGTELNIRVNGQDEGVAFLKPASATVQADGTWSTSVNFSDIAAGSEFTVNVNNGAATADGSVAEAAAPAAFEVSDLSAPGTATVGDEVTATATVANTGGTEGTTTVEFTFGGDVVDSQEVTLAPGESTTVEFSITADVEAGTYTHGISAGDSSQTAEITVEADTTQTPTQTATPTATQTATPTATATATPTEAPTDTDAPDTTEGDDGGQPGFGIGVALVALMGAALLALRRQN
ncbi:DUF7827 domain-containing protein [Haloarchaeobius baliensis]|uniref:DUF7827 domain-containing protein n=1 Tax=Haloarchaeobius baliensis TaxID=1670458 RepID=UPI003F885397